MTKLKKSWDSQVNTLILKLDRAATGANSHTIRQAMQAISSQHEYVKDLDKEYLQMAKTLNKIREASETKMTAKEYRATIKKLLDKTFK